MLPPPPPGPTQAGQQHTGAGKGCAESDVCPEGQSEQSTHFVSLWAIPLER